MSCILSKTYILSNNVCWDTKSNSDFSTKPQKYYHYITHDNCSFLLSSLYWEMSFKFYDIIFVIDLRLTDLPIRNSTDSSGQILNSGIKSIYFLFLRNILILEILLINATKYVQVFTTWPTGDFLLLSTEPCPLQFPVLFTCFVVYCSFQ